MRLGVQGVFVEIDSKEMYEKLCKMVNEWDAEQRKADIDNTPLPVTKAEEKERRKRLREMVQRSEKAYAALFDALLPELQPQIAHIPSGFAYGLWKWLQDKYQSTETDAVHDLIDQWMELRMKDDELFDAYRARVNHVHTLLEHADEKPSVRVYAYKLLDKLKPDYIPAVLALKASGKLKIDGKTVPNWDEVAAFVNAHERNVLRLEKEDSNDESSVPGAAMSARRAYAATARGSTYKNGKGPQCWRCDRYGHILSKCPTLSNAQREKVSTAAQRSAAARSHGATSYDGDDVAEGDEEGETGEAGEPQVTNVGVKGSGSQRKAGARTELVVERANAAYGRYPALDDEDVGTDPDDRFVYAARSSAFEDYTQQDITDINDATDADPGGSKWVNTRGKKKRGRRFKKNYSLF